MDFLSTSEKPACLEDNPGIYSIPMLSKIFGVGRVQCEQLFSNSALVFPATMYPRYRASSVPPGLYRSTNVTNRVRTGGMPSYCPPHGQYYGTSKTVSRTPLTTRITQTSCKPAVRLTSTKYFDPTYPTRQFGTRLSKGYGSSAMSRPEIYEQAYGVSYLPGYGRDSYSAYKIADATFDDSDDLVSASLKKDNAVLRDVERTMRRANCSKIVPTRHGGHNSYHINLHSRSRASSVPPLPSRIDYVPHSYAVRTAGHIVGETDWAVPRVISNIMPSATARILHAKAKAKANISNLPPITRPSTTIRCSSVPPVSHSLPGVKSTMVSKTAVRHRPLSRPGARANGLLYKVPPPKVQYHLETVGKGSQLLSPKERMFAKELVDLTSPAATTALKMRIKDAQNTLQKQGTMISKYYVDKDDIEIDAELRRIKESRALRARSVLNELKHTEKV